jgi:hypothetical protein
MQTTCLTDIKNEKHLSLTSPCSIIPSYRIQEHIPLHEKKFSTENVSCAYMIIRIGSIDINKIINLSNHEFRLKNDSVYAHIDDLIFKNIRMPEDWAQEGVNPPNIEAKNIAKKTCISLYDDYGLIPIRISPTKEEGIFIYYKHFNNNRELFVEVYNNLEVAALVNDEENKKIIYSEDIKGCNFLPVIEKLIEN